MLPYPRGVPRAFCFLVALACCALASPVALAADAPPAGISTPDESPALARRRRSRRKRARKKPAKKTQKKKKRASGPVQIPIDVGFGPVALLPSPPLLFEQPVFTGVTLSIAAIVDRETIEKYKDRIPRQYRRAASRVSRVEVTPWWLKLIPETLVISPDVIPGVTNTGMYGAVWRPLGLGLTFVDEPVRLSANASLALAYFYIHQQTRPDTHFLRPGVTLDATLEVPLGDTLAVSTGWMSDLYVPQPLGTPPWGILPWEDWLWHLGGPFLKIHVRFPYEVAL